MAEHLFATRGHGRASLRDTRSGPARARVPARPPIPSRETMRNRIAARGGGRDDADEFRLAGRQRTGDGTDAPSAEPRVPEAHDWCTPKKRGLCAR